LLKELSRDVELSHQAPAGVDEDDQQGVAPASGVWPE